MAMVRLNLGRQKSGGGRGGGGGTGAFPRARTGKYDLFPEMNTGSGHVDVDRIVS